MKDKAFMLGETLDGLVRACNELSGEMLDDLVALSPMVQDRADAAARVSHLTDVLVALCKASLKAGRRGVDILT